MVQVAICFSDRPFADYVYPLIKNLITNIFPIFFVEMPFFATFYYLKFTIFVPKPVVHLQANENSYFALFQFLQN